MDVIPTTFQRCSSPSPIPSYLLALSVTHRSLLLNSTSTSIFFLSGGRILRTDYADPTRRQKAEVSAPSSTAAPASSSRTAPSSSSSKSDASAWKQGFKNPAAAASLSGKEKSPSKAVKANTSAVSATEGAPVAKRVLDNAAAAAGAGAASSSSWSSSVSGVGGGIVKLPASKLMALNIPDKSAAKEGTFRDRGDSKPAQEGEDVVDVVYMSGCY